MKVISSQSGHITDGTPKNFTYAQNLQCSWLIKAEKNTSVSFIFTRFQTANGSDFVSIYKGSTHDPAAELARYSGHYSEQSLPKISYRGAILVVFSTQTGNGYGWAANYSISDPGSSSTSSTHLPVVNTSGSKRFPIDVILGVLAGLVITSVLTVGVIFWKFQSKLKRKMAMTSSNEKNIFSWRELHDPNAKFSVCELISSTDRFSGENLIGEGSSSLVYKAILSDGRKVAVKRRNSDKDVFNAEHRMLTYIHHEHIVLLIGYSPEDPSIGRLLVFELLVNGSLSYQLHDGGTANGAVLGWRQRLQIALQASQALQFLHVFAEPCIIHGNITSDNILLDDAWNAKLSGFGCAAYSVTCEATTEFSSAGWPSRTPGYVEPEAATHTIATKAGDVYSFGVVLLELLSGRKARDSKCKPAELVTWAVPLIQAGHAWKVLDARLEVPMVTEAALRKTLDVAMWCVSPSRRARPTIVDVVAALEQVLKIYEGQESASGARRSLEAFD